MTIPNPTGPLVGAYLDASVKGRELRLGKLPRMYDGSPHSPLPLHVLPVSVT